MAARRCLLGPEDAGALRLTADFSAAQLVPSANTAQTIKTKGAQARVIAPEDPQPG